MMRRLFSKRTYIVFGILCCMFLWLQFGMESYAFTRTTGEVTGSSVKVRKEASTSAEMVASVRAGDDLDVVDAVNGTDGKVWYKILINANEYGYIRSDFVTLASGEQAPSQNTNTNTTTGESEVTPIDEQKGHTSTNNVKVRKQATTASDEVDRLNQDQIFTISGTSQGPDSKIWYYVSYVDGGASKKGFIRS
ncbi:MAG: SH3 domain-containing protein, partial [Lachnospiraceae bacterium]|nr:SH3 domain-containing protein [Lachnospiraceae bacterium]